MMPARAQRREVSAQCCAGRFWGELDQHFGDLYKADFLIGGWP